MASTGSAAAAPPALPLCLSLAGLEAFVALMGRDALANKTTADVKELLKALQPPLPAAAAVHLPALRPHCGLPTAFISHSYSNPFLGMVESVREWEHSAPPPRAGGCHYYYFDLLVEYQGFDLPGPPAKLQFEFLRDRFGSRVASVEHTLLVLDWSRGEPAAPGGGGGGDGGGEGAGALARGQIQVPRPLTSAWCAFEIAMTTVHNVPLTVLLTKDDTGVFLVDIETDLGALREVMCAVDVESCQAREATDKSGILAFIREHFGEEGGCAEVNRRVNDALRAFMKREGRRVLEATPAARRFSSPFARAYLSLLEKHGTYHDEHEDKHIREVAGAIYKTIAHRFPFPPPLNEDTLYARTLRAGFVRSSPHDDRVSLYRDYRALFSLDDERALTQLVKLVDEQVSSNCLAEAGRLLEELPAALPQEPRARAKREALQRRHLEVEIQRLRPRSPEPNSHSLPQRHSDAGSRPADWVPPPAPASLDGLARAAPGADSLARLSGAAAALQQSIDRTSARDPSRLGLLRTLGEAQAALGAPDAAEALLKEALGLARKLYPAHHQEVFFAEENLGKLLVARAYAEDAAEKYAEAVSVLEASADYHWREFSELNRRPQFAYRGLRSYGYALLGVGVEVERGRLWLARAQEMRLKCVLHFEAKEDGAASKADVGGGWPYWPYYGGAAEITPGYNVDRLLHAAADDEKWGSLRAGSGSGSGSGAPGTGGAQSAGGPASAGGAASAGGSTASALQRAAGAAPPAPLHAPLARPPPDRVERVSLPHLGRPGSAIFVCPALDSPAAAYPEAAAIYLSWRPSEQSGTGAEWVHYFVFASEPRDTAGLTPVAAAQAEFLKIVVEKAPAAAGGASTHP